MDRAIIPVRASTNNCLSNRALRYLQAVYQKKTFDAAEGGEGCIRDRGCATGRQAGRQNEGAVGLLYPRRPIGGSAPGANCCDDFPASSCLHYRVFHLLPLCSHLFPQGVAFNRPGCSPIFSLPAFRFSSLAFTPSSAFCDSSRGRATDGERARKELRLR